MQKIKGVIFDMDGVIVDSEPIHVQAERRVFNKYGINPLPEDWASFKGRTSIDIFSSMVEKYKARNITGEQLAKEKFQTYIEIINRSELRMFQGCLRLIKYLQPKYKLALATSSVFEIKNAVFNKFDLHKYFPITVTGDMVKNGKPHPEPYLSAIYKIGLKPEECAVIEDSDNGIVSGNLAGAYTIAVTHTFPKEKLSPAGRIVDSLSQVQEIL